MDLNSAAYKGNNVKYLKKLQISSHSGLSWHLNFLGTQERKMISIFSNVEVNKQQITWG
jgi:hypothetical protein